MVTHICYSYYKVKLTLQSSSKQFVDEAEDLLQSKLPPGGLICNYAALYMSLSRTCAHGTTYVSHDHYLQMTSSKFCHIICDSQIVVILRYYISSIQCYVLTHHLNVQIISQTQCFGVCLHSIYFLNE